MLLICAWPWVRWVIAGLTAWLASGTYPWPVFSPGGPSVRELAMQALSSVEGGYDRLAPKFDHTPFRTARFAQYVPAPQLGQARPRRHAQPQDRMMRCAPSAARSADADVGQVAAKGGLNLSGSGRVLHTVGMIRLGTSADLLAATSVYRRASLSNAGDRENLLTHPEYLILGPEGLAEGRTHVAEEDGSLVGFTTWIETAGTIELEDVFVDPGYMRHGIAAALINRIVEVLRARGIERLEVTANPHALGFYRAVGFIDCGVAETDFGVAPRMELAIS